MSCQCRWGECDEPEYLAAIERLKAELEGLRTDRQRFADDASREIRRLRNWGSDEAQTAFEAEVQRDELLAELRYIVAYFRNDILPTDLREWMRRADAAIANSEAKMSDEV